MLKWHWWGVVKKRVRQNTFNYKAKRCSDNNCRGKRNQIMESIFNESQKSKTEKKEIKFYKAYANEKGSNNIVKSVRKNRNF